MAAFLRSSLIGLCALIGSHLAAWADDHCPNNPSGTYTFFRGSASYDDEKSKIEALVAPASRVNGGACIVAFYGTTYDKMLAFRRAKWAKDTLVNKGLSTSVIAMELRPLADQDKDNKDLSHLVQIVVGH